MIGIVEILAKLLTNKFGKVIGLLTMGAAIALLVFVFHYKKSRSSKIPVLSLLEKVQYMDQLELVTYNSDEVLILGDPDVLEKILEKIVADSIAIKQRLNDVYKKLEKGKIEKNMMAHDKSLFENKLITLQKEADSLHKTYLDLKNSFHEFKETLSKSNSNAIQLKYGATIASAWKFYANTKNRKEERKASKKLDQAWIQARKERFKNWENLDKDVKAKQIDLDHSTLQRKIKHTDNTLVKLKNESEIHKNNLKILKSKAAYYKKKILDTKIENNNTLNVKNPKLLAILPVKIGVYLNLDKIKIQPQSNSIIEIRIDSIEFSDAEVKVDSSKYYNVSKRKIAIKKEEGGLYYEVFKQLQIGTEIIAKHVEEKSKTNEELQQLAKKKIKSYFQQLFNPYGYKVLISYSGEYSSTTDKEKTSTKAVLDTVYGIDVSHYNGDINWDTVASQNIAFAYAKATQGIDFVDPKFSSNWEGIKTTKIKRGAYHYYLASKNKAASAEAQANFFIKNVGEITSNDNPPMLDLEGSGIGGMSVYNYQQSILKWLQIVAEHYGVKPIIYTNTSFANRYLNHPAFSEYKLWIAAYTKALKPDIPTTWKNKNWYIWQYTANDTLKGIEGYVDLDMKIIR